MKAEVFRQECMKLHAPLQQACPLVHGFQFFRRIAAKQNMVSPCHVTELPETDTMPDDMFQQMGVQQQQVQQGRWHGNRHRRFSRRISG